jgi:hypothetical protein
MNNQQAAEEAQLSLQIEEAYKKMYFRVCQSKAELKAWVKTFLNIDLPDYIVDENSTSCPLDFIYDVYSAARDGDPERTTFVVAASRNSMKTLASAILELLLMVHFCRDVTHQAAILDQSQAAIGYLNNFLQNPVISSYLSTDSSRQKRLKGIPVDKKYRPMGHTKLQVIVANQKSANAQRASVLIFDEVDMIDKNILSESAFIADPDRRGCPPIFIYLSSRKSASGPVQEKIDESADPKNKIKLHKWSAVDFMKKCPDELHRPDLPKHDMYMHQESLAVLSAGEFVEQTEQNKPFYNKIEAFSGCITCPAFIACQARAPKQQGESPSLRDVAFVANVIRNVGEADRINAQLLNLKPESSGTVFNKFSRQKHLMSLDKTWEFAFGEAPVKPVMFKKELVQELRAQGWTFNCGVDFGYVDTATAVLIAYYKKFEKVIFLHCESGHGYGNEGWLEYVKEHVYDKYGFDLLCPDMAYKAAAGISARLGMPSRNTKPALIDPGVSWLRHRLWNTSRQESQLAVVNDSSNAELVVCFEKWQHKRSPMGFDFTKFEDDEYTHHLDSARYAIDPFIMQTGGVLSAHGFDNSKKAPEGADLLQRQLSDHYLQEFGLKIGEHKEPEKSTIAGNIVISF